MSIRKTNSVYNQIKNGLRPAQRVASLTNASEPSHRRYLARLLERKYLLWGQAIEIQILKPLSYALDLIEGALIKYQA